jgi:hypothetical protein
MSEHLIRCAVAALLLLGCGLAWHVLESADPRVMAWRFRLMRMRRRWRMWR